jgi:putative FmdB family regulatory protein
MYCNFSCKSSIILMQSIITVERRFKMPLYDFLCSDCGKISEILVASTNEKIKCGSCGSGNVKKMLSAPSSLSGEANERMPGPGDTACCGSSPGHAGCDGPGSCCGKVPS